MAASRRTQRRPGTNVRRASEPQPEPEASARASTRATKPRVAVMEALERAGGNISDERYGVCSRIVRMGGPGLTNNSSVHAVLRGMESEGWVMLDEVPTDRGPDGGHRIVEVQLIEIPEHFVGPIAKLRRQRGIKWFYQEDVQQEIERRVEAKLREAVTETVVEIPVVVNSGVGSILGMTPEQATERILALEAENEELRITNAALVQFVRETKTEVQL